MNEIIKNVDYFGNGRINYTEFLVATMDAKFYQDENLIKAVFDQFDVSQTGEINKDDIVTTMQKMGHAITEDELNHIMLQHDTNKNDSIDLQEFKQIFYCRE